MRQRSVIIVCIIAIAFLWYSPAGAERFSWSRYRRKDDAWFRSDEGRRVVDNVLTHQTKHGDWPKSIVDATKPLLDPSLEAFDTHLT